MDGVSAMDKTSTTKMVLMTTTLNVALTLERPWLGCKRRSTEIRTLASLLTLSFGYKLVDSFVFVDYGWHTHTICVFSLFLYVFVIGSISFLLLLVHFKTLKTLV
jgi:hypothetical protein